MIDEMPMSTAFRDGGVPVHRTDTLERLVAELHEAALDDSRWRSASTMLNDLLGVEGHALGYGDRDLPEGHEILFARFYFGDERRSDFERTYFRRYYSRDETIRHIRDLGDGELLRIADVYTDRESRGSSYYRKFLRDTKGQNGLRACWHGPGGWRAVLSLADPVGGGDWSSDQIRLVEALGPHLRGCLRVRTVLSDAEALGRSQARLLESTRLGVIQLDRRGRIVEMNDRAAAVLRTEDGLAGHDGVLTCLDFAENAELTHLLVRALSPYRIERVGGSMTISRRDGRGPWRCEVHPTEPADAGSRAWRVAVLVVIHDLESESRIDPRFVADVLGLTPAQSRVAVALADGDTPADIALASGVADSTVRDHLKRIFRKLSIGRQTELVRRVLAVGDLPGSRRPPRNQANSRPASLVTGPPER